MRHAGTSFLLQAFNEPSFSRNFQMPMLVQNVGHWHAYALASGVAQQFGIVVGSPEEQPWGLRDFMLHDPSGGAWRISRNNATQGAP
jgi:uncharacterized glyoxalase superfamily protein PhnB